MSARASILAASALIAAAGCAPAGDGNGEDPRLSALTFGIKRDSLFRLLGSGAAPTDSLPNVQRKESYLIRGQLYEILFFSLAGVTEPAPAESTLRPVVLGNDTVLGWGWKYFDSVAVANDIRVKPR